MNRADGPRKRGLCSYEALENMIGCELQAIR
jgi:hypothetical protein